MISEYQGSTPTDRFIQGVLLEYSEGDHEFERELITSYMTSVEEHLPELTNAFKAQDTKNAILHSHDIKGSSSYIGAEAVRFLSGKIEAYCKSDKLEEAESFLPELKTEVTEVFKILNDYMDSWEEGGGESNNNNEDENGVTEKDSTDIKDNNTNNNNSNNTNNNNNNNTIDNLSSSSSSSSPNDQQDKKTDKIATETVNNNNNNNSNNNNNNKSNIESDKINEKINNTNSNTNTTTKIDS